MCWSLGASAILSVLGLFAAGLLYYRKYDKMLFVPVIYFSLMEAIQSFTYFYINDCSYDIYVFYS